LLQTQKFPFAAAHFRSAIFQRAELLRNPIIQEREPSAEKMKMITTKTKFLVALFAMAMLLGACGNSGTQDYVPEDDLGQAMCLSDEDCAENEVCTDNSCSCIEEPPATQCLSDDDCAENEFCTDNVCSPIENPEDETDGPCSYDAAANRKECILDADTPEEMFVRMTNTNDNEVSFKIAFNDKLFLQTPDEILDEIESMLSDFPEESMPARIMRFIGESSYHKAPITDAKWGHSPVLYLNSIGFGFCDDVASIFRHIATDAGYKARVWAARGPDGGHFIAEAFADDKWQMYDPDYGVYFMNPDGSIAGVKDLQSDLDLILDPVEEMDTILNPYTEKYAALFSTSGDDEVLAGYNQTIDSQALQFTLPPDARIEFPAVFHSPLISPFDNTDIPSYTNLRITIPAGYTGAIEHFLVLHTIQGSGTVKIDEQSFEVGSDSLSEYINDRSTFIYGFDIVESDTDIEIIYLLNPKRAVMQTSNSLEIEGAGSEGIDVEVVDTSK